MTLKHVKTTMASKTDLETVQDDFTGETAQLKSFSRPKTFGANCGATFRMPVRLISRVQQYLSDNHDVQHENMATTGDALEQLLLALDIVDSDSDDVSLYFDTRKESVIREEREQATAQHVRDDIVDNSEYMALESQIAAYIKQHGESDETRETVSKVIDTKAPKQFRDALHNYVEQRLPATELNLFA